MENRIFKFEPIEDIWVYSLLFVLGASIASFYCNITYRVFYYFYSPHRKKLKLLDKWKNTLFVPSSCEGCKKRIPTLYLIPILGYFFTKGSCKKCGFKIPYYYPLIEILLGSLGVMVYFLTSQILPTICFLLLTGHLYISARTDFSFYSLDYENLVWILIWGVCFNFFLEGHFPRIEEYLTMAGFFGFFLVVHIFYPKGMGLGDVLFAPIFAFLSTHPWWLFFLNSSYVLAIIFTFLFRKPGKPISKVPIPMGLYFCIGLFLTILARMYYYKYGFQLSHE